MCCRGLRSRTFHRSEDRLATGLAPTRPNPLCVTYVMDVRQIVDFDKIHKQFDKLGEFVEGFFDEIEGAKTFVGDPEKAGIRVTKSKPGDSPFPAVKIEIEVPGCGPTEVDVNVVEGRLTVRWTPKMTGKEQERTFSLSKNVAVDGVQAIVKHGYLTVTIPGVPGKTPAHKVTVVSGA